MATTKQDLLTHYKLWKSEGHRKYGVGDPSSELALYFEIDEGNSKGKYKVEVGYLDFSEYDELQQIKKLRVHPIYFDEDYIIRHWGNVREITAREYYDDLLNLCNKLSTYIKQGKFIGSLPKSRLDETGEINESRRPSQQIPQPFPPTPPPSRPTTPLPPQRPSNPLDNFFAKYGITNKTAWSAYQTEAEAEAVYNNAISAINNITEAEKQQILNAKTPNDINSAKNNILAQRIEQAKGEENQKAQNLLNQINQQTDSNLLPTDNSIQTAYDEKVADSKFSYAKLKEARDNKRTELLKIAEIKKYDDLLTDINGKTKLKDLPANYKQAEIQALNNAFLPNDKQKEILTTAIETKRANFTLSLRDKDDTGDIDEAGLNAIRTKQQNKYENLYPEEKKSEWALNSKILEEVMKPYRTKLGISDRDTTDEDLIPYLKSEFNAYDLNELTEKETIKVKGVEQQWSGKEIKDQEEKWQKEGSSEYKSLFLPFFYKKSDFDPDNLDWTQFAKFKWDGNRKLRDLTKGVLTMPPGQGKSTLTMYSVLKGGKENVIICVPSENLGKSLGEAHQAVDFLQSLNYRCPYDGKNYGKYEVKVNDLTQWEDADGNLHGKAGISILDINHYAGYIARDLLFGYFDLVDGENRSRVKEGWKLLKVNRLDANFATINGELKAKLDRARNKRIPRNSLIFFDEQDESKPVFQQFISQTLFYEDETKKDRPKYRTELMSATCKGKPSSITSSYRMLRRETTHFKKTTTHEGDSFVDFDDKLANSKTLSLLPSTNLDENQKKALAKVPYVILNSTNADASIGISMGMPEGSIIFHDATGRRGLNLHCHVVADSALEERIKIGGGWIIERELVRYSSANREQGAGRCARFMEGWYYTLDKKTEEPDAYVGTSGNLVKALFGDCEGLQRTFFKGKNKKKLAIIIQAAFALEDHFGKEPEAILMGLSDGKLSSAADGDCYPTWIKNKSTTWDETLWQKFQGTYQPPKADKNQAEQTLILMIQTYLNRQKDITKEIRVGFSSQLIKDAEWKLNDEETINKIQGILNGIVDSKLKLVSGYVYNKINYKGDEEASFRQVVDLLKVVRDTKIAIVETRDNKGVLKKDWGIDISYQRA